MSDYTELVKALRLETDYVAVEKTMRDAAAAIEALQAEVDTLKRTDSKRCQECLYLGQPVGEQQLPKRGEWYTELYDGDKKYQCSNCLTHWDVETRYCPFCGAKMEVQDGQ